MNEKQKRRWEKIRRKGESDFVLIKGDIVFGFLGFGILIPILQFLIKYVGNDFSASFFDKEFQFKIIAGLFFSFPIGCLFGWLMWTLNEWQYSRSK